MPSRIHPEYISINELPDHFVQSPGNTAPATISVYGNIDLLHNRKLVLFCSQHCPPSLLLPWHDTIKQLCEMDITIVGGFHSLLEQEALTILLAGTAPIIICPACGIGNMYFPPEYEAPMTAGRLLILSFFPDEVKRPSRQTALERNTLLAALANEVFVAYAHAGGQIEQICYQVIKKLGQKLYTLPSNHNQLLIHQGAKSIDQFLKM